MSPRDKAKVEVGVQIAERWLLARIRNEKFESLGALNARLSELTADLNDRVMRTYKASRRELFERLDRPALAPLPEQPFEAATWKKVGLNIDYHVEFDHHLYSASYTLIHEELWCARRRAPWRSCTAAPASLPTYAATSAAGAARRRSTCRACARWLPHGSSKTDPPTRSRCPSTSGSR
jgi:hypothetical protein